jgi:hypothetical protein
MMFKITRTKKCACAVCAGLSVAVPAVVNAESECPRSAMCELPSFQPVDGPHEEKTPVSRVAPLRLMPSSTASMGVYNSGIAYWTPPRSEWPID